MGCIHSFLNVYLFDYHQYKRLFPYQAILIDVRRLITIKV